MTTNIPAIRSRAGAKVCWSLPTEAPAAAREGLRLLAQRGPLVLERARAAHGLERVVAHVAPRAVVAALRALPGGLRLGRPRPVLEDRRRLGRVRRFLLPRRRLAALLGGARHGVAPRVALLVGERRRLLGGAARQRPREAHAHPRARRPRGRDARDNEGARHGERARRRAREADDAVTARAAAAAVRAVHARAVDVEAAIAAGLVEQAPGDAEALPLQAAGAGPGTLVRHGGASARARA